MGDKKLIIHSKPYKGDSSLVSIRLNNDLLSKIDKISNDTGRTRTEIIVTCLEFAVENIEIEVSE